MFMFVSKKKEMNEKETGMKHDDE